MLSIFRQILEFFRIFASHMLLISPPLSLWGFSYPFSFLFPFTRNLLLSRLCSNFVHSLEFFTFHFLGFRSYDVCFASPTPSMIYLSSSTSKRQWNGKSFVKQIQDVIRSFSSFLPSWLRVWKAKNYRDSADIFLVLLWTWASSLSPSLPVKGRRRCLESRIRMNETGKRPDNLKIDIFLFAYRRAAMEHWKSWLDSKRRRRISLEAGKWEMTWRENNVDLTWNFCLKICYENMANTQSKLEWWMWFWHSVFPSSRHSCVLCSSFSCYLYHMYAILPVSQSRALCTSFKLQSSDFRYISRNFFPLIAFMKLFDDDSNSEAIFSVCFPRTRSCVFIFIIG